MLYSFSEYTYKASFSPSTRISIYIILSGDNKHMATNTCGIFERALLADNFLMRLSVFGPLSKRALQLHIFSWQLRTDSWRCHVNIYFCVRGASWVVGLWLLLVCSCESFQLAFAKCKFNSATSDLTSSIARQQHQPSICIDRTVTSTTTIVPHSHRSSHYHAKATSLQ